MRYCRTMGARVPFYGVIARHTAFFRFCLELVVKLDGWSVATGKITPGTAWVLLILLVAPPAHVAAQGFGGGTATVSVAEATEDVLATFVEVQGRVAAGRVTAITATINAVTDFEALRIGDRVKAGQPIAQQDDGDLRNRLDILGAQRREAGLRVGEVTRAMESDLKILEFQNAQLELLSGKADRARQLVARNALAVDSADTATGAVLKVQEEIAKREATLAGRRYQLRQAEATIDRLDLQIRRLKTEIAGAKIIAPVDGQIVYLHPARRGYLREGDVLIRTRSESNYEVEAEIPVEYLLFVRRNKTIDATDLSNEKLSLSTRVILPVQNIRTGTQTVRFTVRGELPASLRADNAPVTIRVPTTSPAPVVTVPKDAVLPISGGHVVFLAADGVALQRRIRLGNAAGDSFVVLDGLSAGDPVVVRGNEGLVDGRRIKIGDPGKRPEGPKGDKWTLNWTTRRGPASGDLVIGKETSFFNDEPVEITRVGDDINFIGKLVLPFGVIDLEFIGRIKGDEMAGKVTLRGFPGGNEPTLDFTGARDAE